MRQTKSNASQNVTKHLGARTIKIPINNVKKLTGIGFLPASEAPRKTHMAYRKKIQGTYFKISALYFKIYALCFSLQGEAFFQRHYAGKKYMEIFRTKNAFECVF